MKQFIDIPRINKYKGDKESDREKGINWRLSQITAEKIAFLVSTHDNILGQPGESPQIKIRCIS